MLTLYILILLIPFHNHPILGKNLIGSFTLIKLVGLIALLHGLVYRMSGGGQNLLKTNTGKLFCAFTLFALASFIVFYDPYIGHSKHYKHISFFTFFIVALTFIDSKDKLRKCLWVCVLAMVLGSLSMIKQSVTLGGRPPGSFGDPNIYAANAALMLPVSYYLFLSEKRYIYRMALLGMMTLIMGGFLVAQSRGAIAGFLTSLLIMSWRSSKKLKAFLGIALLVIILIPLIPEGFWARMGYFGYEQSAGARISSESHKQRWIAGVNMIKEHPVFGVGLDNFYHLLPRYNPELEEMKGGQAHNGYIEITAELGIPGFCVFALMLAFTFTALKRTRSRTAVDFDSALNNFSKGLEAGLFGFLISLFFVDAQYQKLFWLAIFLVIVLENIELTKAGPTLISKSHSALAVIRNKRLYSTTFKRALRRNRIRPLPGFKT